MGSLFSTGPNMGYLHHCTARPSIKSEDPSASG
jgi:hypothetical protein